MWSRENGVEIPRDEPADALRAEEVIVARLGAESIGAEEDTAADFGAEEGGAGGGVEIGVYFFGRVCRGGGGVMVFGGGDGGGDGVGDAAVADGVVFGEVGAGFGGREDVVGWEGVGGVREGDGVDGVAFCAEVGDGLGPGGAHGGGEGGGGDVFVGDADAETTR